MRLVSVQVGKVREVVDRGRAVRTAIYKEPVHLRVRARTLGLEGDTQADQRVHGGPDKAVYAYDLSRYAHWKRELGADFLPGQFGENLTVEGMPDTQISLGDVYRVGSALLQVTEPRGPCFKLAIKMKHPRFPRMFLASGRTGFYPRVREEGELGAGDAITPDPVTVEERVREIYGG
jgi:MOSC domain-containing protein YiiM